MSRRMPVSPDDYDEERLSPSEDADFRCHLCGWRYPMRLLVIQDGARLCSVNCAKRESKSEREMLKTEERLEAVTEDTNQAQRTAVELARGGNWSLMQGVTFVESFTSGSTVYPAQIRLTPGGASAPVLLTGLFAASDVLSYSAAGLSNSTPSIAANLLSMTFNTSASISTTPGDYDFLHNGTRFPKAFAVRS